MITVSLASIEVKEHYCNNCISINSASPVVVAINIP